MQNNINQSRLDFSCGTGSASVNVFNGSLLFGRPDISMGANNFAVGVSHIYCGENFAGLNSRMGNGWRLNIQQYIKQSGSLYLYTDENGYKHEFEYYAQDAATNAAKYFDRTGLGLTLYIGQNRYIQNAQGGKLVFDTAGRLIETVSAINTAIVKKIDYNAAEQISAIYDNRKQSRKIIFSYNKSGLLSEINCVSEQGHKLKVFYDYDAQDNLTGVSEYANGDERSTVLYKYTAHGLRYVMRLNDGSAMKFDYNADGRIANVATGIMKYVPVFDGEKQTTFASDSCAGQVYSGGIIPNFVGFKVSGNDEDFIQQSSSSFSYQSNRTTVTNEKHIGIDYFFNEKGFTTGIFERRDKNQNDLMTLTKDGGVLILDNTANTGEKINNHAVINVPFEGLKYLAKDYNVIGSLQSYKDVPLLKAVTEYTYGDGKDDKRDAVNYVLSFWMKHAGAAKGSKANVYAKQFWSNADGHTASHINDTETYIDSSAENVWQYVTVPVCLCKNMNVVQFELTFPGLFGAVDLANLRIAAGDEYNLKIDNKSYQDLETLRIFNGSSNKDYVLGIDCFFTEQDLFCTCKNMFKNPSNFDIVCDAATKRISGAASVIFVDKDNAEHTLTLDSDGKPNYEMRITPSNTADEISTIMQVRFRTDYFQQEAIVTKGNNKYHSFVWTNNNGLPRAKKDARGVLTHYYYDNYGNITRIETQKQETKNIDGVNTDVMVGDKLLQTFSYSETEMYRELPIESTSGGITSTTTYSSPFMQTDTETVKGGYPPMYTAKYSYDAFGKVKSISAMSGQETIAGNVLTYDRKGNLHTVTDGCVKYGFGYSYNNDLNKITVFDGGIETTLQEKEFAYNTGTNQNSTITEKVYGEGGNLINKTLTSTDKYSRPKSVTENAAQMTYRYQDEGNPYAYGDARGEGWAFNESPSVAKITQINDPYDGQTYNYHYDEDNRPCGYNTSGNTGKELKQLFVQQINSEETKYAIGDAWAGEKYVTRIINDENLLAPRVADTKVYYDEKPNDAKDNDWKEMTAFSRSYGYDSLGRLTRTYTEKVEDAWWWIVVGFCTSQTTKSTSSNVTYEKEGDISTGRVSSTTFSSGYNKKTTTFYPYTTGDTTYESKYNTLAINYEYDARGNMIKQNSGYTSYKDAGHNYSNTKEYTYDACNRLASEKDSALGINRNYLYDPSKHGRLSGITDHNNASQTASYTYDGRGRLKQVNYASSSRQYGYDNYGNRTSKENYTGSSLMSTASYTYTRKNRLSALQRSDNGISASYGYNGQGIRFNKSVNGALTTYYIDGTKLLAEDRPDGKKLRYFYDLTGICGFRYINGNETKDYNFGKDALGNIVMMTAEDDTLIARYEYDAYGNCKVYDPDGSENTSLTFIGNINPFRWKSFYRDEESGFYAVNTSGGTRYYEPETGLYLDASDLESLLVMAAVLFGLDRNAISLYNILNVIPNLNNIQTATELYTDPYYDANTNLTWWDRNMKWIIPAIIVVVSALLTFVTAGVSAYVGGATLAGAAAAGAHAVGAMLMFAAKTAISGAIISGVVGGLVAACTGQNILEGFLNSAVQGYIDGFATGCAMYAVFSTFKMIGAIVEAHNRLKAAKTLTLDGIVLESDPRIDLFAKNVVPESGYFDVVAHGNANSVGRMNAKQLADVILKSPNYSGESIRIFACNAGAKANGIAQQLADTLNVVVKAPTDIIMISTSGTYKILNSGFMKIFV